MHGKGWKRGEKIGIIIFYFKEVFFFKKFEDRKFVDNGIIKVVKASGYSVYILTLPGTAPHPDDALEMNIESSSLGFTVVPLHSRSRIRHGWDLKRKPARRGDRG